MILTIGLKELKKIVAVTGEGINDVDALKSANVGFSMGGGISAARDAADMIITSENFEGAMIAVMWGRNIILNIKKFIQFQLTVNISTILVVLLASAVRGNSPLTIVQLLWINLIMDTLAALTLATERPHPSVVKDIGGKKNYKKDQIMTKSLWFKVYATSFYIFIVITVLYFFVDHFFGINYDPDVDPLFNPEG